MVGITLSPEQINRAPPEVRRWIEQEISRAIGFAPRANSKPEYPSLRLRTIDVAEAEAILQQIGTVLPVVSVFFELGRETGMSDGRGVRVLQLADIASHALLHIPAQVSDCIEVINRVAAQLDPEAHSVLCAIDENGHCFITDDTARSILAVWRRIVAERALSQERGSTSGTAPAQTVHVTAPTQTQPLSYGLDWRTSPNAPPSS